MDGAGLEVNLAQMIGFDAFSRRSVCGTRGNLYERGLLSDLGDPLEKAPVAVRCGARLTVAPRVSDCLNT